MSRDRRGVRAGFTLAEVAVTIVIVGIVLVMVLQGLNTAKFQAAHTRNLKLARDLSLLTLGQIQSGLFEDEVDSGHMLGFYEEYPDFEYEVTFGDESFLSDEDRYRYDPWRRDPYEDYDEDEDEADQAFEKIRIKVIFPYIEGYKNELTMEYWAPWDQLYPDEESDDSDSDEGDEG